MDSQDFADKPWPPACIFRGWVSTDNRIRGQSGRDSGIILSETLKFIGVCHELLATGLS